MAQRKTKQNKMSLKKTNGRSIRQRLWNNSLKDAQRTKGSCGKNKENNMSEMEISVRGFKKNLKRNQKEIQQLKIKITEMKSSWKGSKVRYEQAEEIIVNLKTGQWKL